MCLCFVLNINYLETLNRNKRLKNYDSWSKHKEPYFFTSPKMYSNNSNCLLYNILIRFDNLIRYPKSLAIAYTSTVRFRSYTDFVRTLCNIRCNEYIVRVLYHVGTHNIIYTHAWIIMLVYIHLCGAYRGRVHQKQINEYKRDWSLCLTEALVLGLVPICKYIYILRIVYDNAERVRKTPTSLKTTRRYVIECMNEETEWY